MTNFNKKNKLFKPFITAVTVIFLISSLGTGSYATILPSLVEPGTLMSLSEPFNGPALLGIQIFPQDPLKFSFILGQGERPLDETSVRAISEKSIRYFLAGLAIPEQDLWVNLSPYESDRIISDVLGKTEIGQDMLAQDYILKQLAASLTYPESDLGKKFWDTVTQRARERFGNVDIPMDIFNKVWIIPDHSVVYETTDRAVVAEAKLKVLLEQDYFALQQNAPGKSSDNEPNPIAQEVMREIVIPLLEKEVNEGSHFAPLRQIFHALILSSWFKDKLKMNAVAQVYGNQKKISGIVSPDLQAVEQVYQEYLKAYQIGAYDYIKEEAVTENGEVVPRRYFSGGEVWKNVSKTRTDVALLSKDEFTRRISPILGKNPLRADARLNPLTRPASRDTAMLVSIKTAGASDPNIGKSRLIEIKKALFDPKLARLKATLQSLDYLYEALETLYQKDARWKHWMDYFRDRLHPQKIAARKILRVLIQQIKTDFEEQSAGAAEDFHYDFRERLPKILDPDDVEAFIQATVGSISLYSIVERIMNNPYSLPRIPATPDARHIVEHLNRKVAVTQRWKFQDAFNLIQRELMDYATRTQGEEQTIAFGYLAYLMEAHKNVTEGTANAFTNQVISVARAEVRKQLHLDPNASEDLLVERIRQSARAAVNMLLDGRPITSPTTNADVEISDDLDEQIVNESKEAMKQVLDIFVDTVYDEVKEDMQRRGITTVLSKKEAREGLLIQQISSGYAQALTIELEKMKVVPTNNLNILLAQRKKAEKILTEELPKITAEGGTGEALTAIQRQLEIIEKDTNLQHSVIELQLQKMPAARNEREAISNQAQALLNAIDSGIKINRQSIATAMDTYEIAGTIFNETLWQWHWETNELGEAILADVLKETQRAETQIYQYINALNDEANELSSKSPELIKLREVIRFYLNTSLDMLIAVHLKHTQDDAVGSEESIKPEERMTHSMRWIVLEGAVTRVLNAPVQELDKKGIPAKEIGSYRQLLREIGRRIIRSAEFELPALAPGEKVTVKWDYVPRPDEFRVILDRISRDLVNIIAPGGLTSHVVFTAAANGVGVLSVPEGIKVPISEHQQIVVSRDEHGDTYIDLLAPEEVPTDIPVDLLSKEMLAKAFSFMSDRDVLSNADSEQEVGQFARGGVGLGRAENIRAFFPTRQVFTKNKIAVIKKIHHEGVAEFRVIDLQEDKLLLILSHLKNVGEKFYLTHPLGIELFKEDLRSSLDLVRWQRALPNNDPNKGKRLRCKLPMIENMDDINQAKAIIDQVLEEEGFEDFNRGIPPELGFSIMIETPAAFENLDKFLQIDWIEAFSWGTNDYTAKKKKVKRNDPSAAAVFTDVHPSIIMDIRHGTRKILDAKGDVSICGALADRQRFWILRAIERHFFANVPNVSMPGNDVPSYNGVNVVMRQLIDEKHPDVTAIVGLLERMNDEPQGTDLDQKYSTKLNEALQKLSLRVDDRLRETVRARLELPANDESMNGPHKDTIQSPSTQNKDTAMLTADPARTPENTDGYGGVDFTQYRDSMTVSQNSQTATVPLPDGKTITIGGPDFAGFTFNIIQIVPYTVGM